MSVNRVLVQVAALGMATSVLFGVGDSFAHASPVAVADFPAAALSDDVDWAAVQKAFGDAELEEAQSATTFALARIAKRRGTSFTDVLDEIGAGAADHSLSPEWVLRQARDNDYPVNDTPSIGSLAYFDDGHLAYVAAVNDDGTVTLEDYGRYTGDGYQNYRQPTSSVSNFIHIGQTRKQEWLSGAFEPSSPGVPRDISQDPVLGNDYKAEEMFRTYGHGSAKLADFQQCGTYAEWWIINRAGGDYSGFFEKTNLLKVNKHVGTSAGSAGRMDELYTDIGVKVDKTPAVGAVATWDPGDSLLGSPFGPDGHAAVVSRAYRLNKSDQAAIDKLASSKYPDARKLKKYIDDAAASPSTPKITYVLLEDYNGFGSPLSYGQKLLRADLVKHFIHLGTSELVKPITPDQRLDRFLTERPTLAGLLGDQTGTETVGDQVKRLYRNGAVVYNTATKQFGYTLTAGVTQEQRAAISADKAAATPAEATARERLEAQIQRINDQLTAAKQKYAGKQQSSFMTDALTALTTKLLQLQSKLVTTIA
ncbi:CHAP domain-containing protein [Lentzea sp. NPDC051838]|uniref:CHAP domain-containing protein n=1 Tax=Lentzea sp. NPDC051838 TaxID=3154849 RepID=UPI00342E54C5